MEQLRADLGQAQPKKLIVGSGGIPHEPAWVSTDRHILDVTDAASWERLLGPVRLDNVLAEHVWEHLGHEDSERASRNVRAFLTPGGRFRIAVPDGCNPDKAYIEHVRPGGRGPGADDHKVLYTHGLLVERLEAAGFRSVQRLEYWDEDGRFHFHPWRIDDGLVRRSRQFDPRNADGALNYTSLIVDAIA